MNLFNLVAKLSLEDDSYEKGLDKAKKDASSFSSKAGVAFKNIGRVIAGVAGAVSAVATGITALLVKTSNYGDEIDKQSQKMGLSAEAYQKWAIAAEMAGSNAATLQTGIRQLTKFTQDLADGTGESLLALQELGIGYDDFMNMSFDDQLKTVVEAMQGLEDSTKKTELAQQIFGNRAYQELMPLLRQEKGSIDELFVSYEDLGLIMSDEMVKKSAELNDKMTLLTKQVQMLGVNIGTQLYPQMELFIDGMSQVLQGNFNEGFDKISDAINGLLEAAINVLPQILDFAATLLLKIIEKLVEVIGNPEFLRSLLNLLMDILNKVIELIPSLVDSLLDMAIALIDAIIHLDWGGLLLTLINTLVKLLTETLPDFVLNIVDMVIKLVEDFARDPSKFFVMAMQIGEAILTGIIQIVAKLPELLMDIMSSLPEMLLNILLSLVDLFTTPEGLKKLAKIGVSMAQGIVNGLIQMLESGINLIIDGISSIWTWLGIKGLDHIKIPRVDWVSKMAEGGIMDELGTLYLAGEKGAEIVATGSQGTGVANVEQIEEAVYKANQRSDRQLATAIVNGLASGLSNDSGNLQNLHLTVVLGNKELKDFVVKTANESLNQKGRKNLNAVTGY